MRILHVFDHSIPLQSGYTFRSRSILLQQRKLGWETVHVTSGKQGQVGADREIVDGLEFFRTPPPGPPPLGVPVVDQVEIIRSLQRRIGEVAAETSPDIIHAHSPVLNGLAALRAGRKAGIPVVYEIRAFWEDAAVDHGTASEGGLRYRLTRQLETFVVKRVDAVTTICEGLRSDLVSRGVDEGHITIIPNAVDADRFEFDSPRDPELEATFGLHGKPVIGFIGSFYAYEGVIDLVEAFPDVLAVHPDIRLLLVGGGPCHEQVVSRVAELDLGDAVVCTGRVPHDEVARYYSLVDAFCYPRIPMRLTELVTPLKPLEAMAQGKIVFASDIGGHRELIDNHETGILFESGSKRALIAALVDGFANRSAWPAMKQAARTFVETERSWAKSVGNYADVYDTALESVTGRRS